MTEKEIDDKIGTLLAEIEDVNWQYINKRKELIELYSKKADFESQRPFEQKT